MKKSNSISTILLAAALTSMMTGCLASETDAGDEAPRESTEAAIGQPLPDDDSAVPAPADQHGDRDAETALTSLGVDWRICWPVAGLYYDACQPGVRENMSSGTAIEYAGAYAWCGSEYWYYVTNLWTGHHGWVRVGALC
jgi:hypothetical protein